MYFVSRGYIKKIEVGMLKYFWLLLFWLKCNKMKLQVKRNSESLKFLWRYWHNMDFSNPMHQPSVCQLHKNLLKILKFKHLVPRQRSQLLLPLEKSRRAVLGVVCLYSPNLKSKYSSYTFKYVQDAIGTLSHCCSEATSFPEMILSQRIRSFNSGWQFPNNAIVWIENCIKWKALWKRFMVCFIKKKSVFLVKVWQICFQF